MPAQPSSSAASAWRSPWRSTPHSSDGSSCPQVSCSRAVRPGGCPPVSTAPCRAWASRTWITPSRSPRRHERRGPTRGGVVLAVTVCSRVATAAHRRAVCPSRVACGLRRAVVTDQRQEELCDPREAGAQDAEEPEERNSSKAEEDRSDVDGRRLAQPGAPDRLYLARRFVSRKVTTRCS